GERTGTHEQNSSLHIFWRAGSHRSQTIYRKFRQPGGMPSTFEECVRSLQVKASYGSNRTPDASSRLHRPRNVGRPQEKQTGTWLAGNDARLRTGPRTLARLISA